MCIAIVAREGRTLTNNQLWQGWNTNSHGGGFAYVKNGQVVIEKGFMKYNDFQRAYATAAETYGKDSPMLIHMRIATSGLKSPNNTHPFKIKGGAMIHNGIMFTPSGKRVGNADDLRSDTRVFAEDLHNILELASIKKAGDKIMDAVGTGNKLCFLYDNKEFVILGEDMGVWDEGIWHSNSSCGVSRYNRASSK